MIDRRRFVQSMIALGAATSVRPPATLFGAQGSTELRDLADAALASAKKLGATYADIRINRYRNQFIFTRDRRVQNIVNTEDYGFGLRADRRRHLGLCQQQRRDEGRDRAHRGAGRRHRESEPQDQRGAGAPRARRSRTTRCGTRR